MPLPNFIQESPLHSLIESPLHALNCDFLSGTKGTKSVSARLPGFFFQPFDSVSYAQDPGYIYQRSFFAPTQYLKLTHVRTVSGPDFAGYPSIDKVFEYDPATGILTETDNLTSTVTTHSVGSSYIIAIVTSQNLIDQMLDPGNGWTSVTYTAPVLTPTSYSCSAAGHYSSGFDNSISETLTLSMPRTLAQIETDLNNLIALVDLTVKSNYTLDTAEVVTFGYNGETPISPATRIVSGLHIVINSTTGDPEITELWPGYPSLKNGQSFFELYGTPDVGELVEQPYIYPFNQGLVCANCIPNLFQMGYPPFDGSGVVISDPVLHDAHPNYFGEPYCEDWTNVHINGAIGAYPPAQNPYNYPGWFFSLATAVKIRCTEKTSGKIDIDPFTVAQSSYQIKAPGVGGFPIFLAPGDILNEPLPLVTPAAASMLYSPAEVVSLSGENIFTPDDIVRHSCFGLAQKPIAAGPNIGAGSSEGSGGGSGSI